MADNDGTSSRSGSSLAHHHAIRSSSSRSPRSHGSYETGESSTVASLHRDSSTPARSLADNTSNDPRSSPRPAAREPEHEDRDLKHETQRRRRSYKPRSSGGFLLANPIASKKPAPIAARQEADRRRSRIPSSSRKGKQSASPSEENGPGRGPETGLGTGAQATDASDRRQTSSSLRPHTGDTHDDSEVATGASTMPQPHTATAPLDLDSSQIVNMALNLSESRRLASRRSTINPVPPRLAPVPDSPTGGSLKQHLQQQRRTSRNISPMPVPPRSATSSGFHSPLPPALEHDGSYKYHFSSSTLNRAQKAKEYLELMAQYRRLLHFVPPLKQDARSRPTTATPPTSPDSTPSPPSTLTGAQNRPLGRPYNPLQHIRNRKIRARERKTIDGEEQGFADVSRVTDWVDETASLAATTPGMNRSSALPPFPPAHEDYDPHLPISVSAGGKQPRPRIDWTLDPADMLADTYWLELGDNKYMIEDRHYSKVFPRAEPDRPSSHQSHDLGKPTILSPVVKEEDSRAESVDPDSGDSKAAKMDAESSLISARERARQKLHDLRGAHHKHSASATNHHDFLRFRRGSLSETSDSETDRRRRQRSGTVSANGRDLLEKQMMELLVQEAQEEKENKNSNESDGDHPKPLPESFSSPEKRARTPEQGQSRRQSAFVELHDRRDGHKNGRFAPGSPISSGRASLEVPVQSYRASMDMDSSRPVSPDVRTPRGRGTRLPIIGMDLSPSGSRPGSPVRNPFSKVKSMFRDRSRERGEEKHHDGLERVDSPVEQAMPPGTTAKMTDEPQVPERRRSKSPGRRIVARATGESHKSHRSVGSLKLRPDEQVGLRNLFKGGAKIDGMIRGGVSKVTDLIWKKDSDTDSDSETSTSDESESESKGDRIRNSITLSRSSSRRREARYAKNYLDVMPSFKSTGDLNDKPNDKPNPQEADSRFISPPISRTHSRSARFEQLKPPRIDIRVASPPGSELDYHKPRQLLDSDVSDTEARSRDVEVFADRPRSTSRDLQHALSIASERRPSTLGLHRDSITQMRTSRQWSISDHSMAPQHGRMSKRELARVRTLILCSGIKAMEITRRANEPHPIFALDIKATGLPWTDVARFASDEHASLSLPQTELYPNTARLLAGSVEQSAQTFEHAATRFTSEHGPALMRRIETLHTRIAGELIDQTRRAVDEADEVSRDMVDSQRLKVKAALDSADKLLRRRRRRFRWVRRAGWLALEWLLVGFMWYVWFIVMIARVFLGIGRGVVGVARWLLWL
ncbi:hypothetical protein F4780DRAFT_343512 [Xylariomycetidae sp. FL0641]|nr:hypothetical protein F4780DRAFT_343512 [Xylariomycetidae sp. FL0641]